ncbi:exonuclease domain-containing protein [Microcoleus sp. Pol12B5]|uniref:exonuclease domain-containing protein n=1 Tax=Microcoleus sp. Pol12B5 TaxID=3055396 RepID=UPI002FD7244A
MTFLFVVDTETTGLSAETAQLCEISGTLYRIGPSKETTGAIASVSALMPVKFDDLITNESEAINGITQELTESVCGFAEGYGYHKHAVDLFVEMANSADYVFAFNAEFDKAFLKTLIRTDNWICAMQDFDWGYPKKAHGNYKLIDLALWLGIGISTAHRAGDDVRLLVECLNRSKGNLRDSIDKAIVRANSPIFEVQALVSYADRELAKAAGFSWNAPQKIWLKQVKECDFQEFVQTLSFEVEVF